MDPILARLISKGRGGKTAEVVVILGEGPQKLSVTRHIKKMDGKWWGRNPDEGALENLATAEKIETAAVKAFEEHNGILKAAKARLEHFKETKKLAKEKGIILDPRHVARIERGLRVDLNNIAPFVASAGNSVKIAKESANALRKTTSAIAEFVF